MDKKRKGPPMEKQENKIQRTSLLNKADFDETIETFALAVPKKLTGPLLKLIRKCLFSRRDLRNFNYLVKGDANNTLILKQSIGADGKGLPQEVLAYITEHDLKIVPYSLKVGFDNKSLDSILRTLLPDEKEITTKFETVGHIAHINLRDENLPHKFLIGEVILQKNRPTIRTVVNKVGFVEAKFRTLPMEVIAGDDDTMATLTESGCQFKFDFREVFWNSRLENEHMRLIKKCSASDIVCDVFAGVGPFAVPLARKGIFVYCNDLNPYCHKAMIANADANLGKRKRPMLKAFNLDGRDFIKQVVSKECFVDGTYKPITQVFMNLPMTAHEFVDAFIGVFPKECTVMPMIHCYCFATGLDNRDQVAKKKIEDILGTTITPTEIYKVRQTSVNTFEFCVSFKLPKQIAYVK